MNIHELDSYNLGDAVKFHRRLNPRIWGRDEHLLPEVRNKLLAIAADFQEFLGVDDLTVRDITISGSNAAYSYTKNSDIDLHLVVEMPADPVYQELFTAKKYQYNDEHNIKIGGADVELYVQPADQAHHSLGIYSVKNGDWISVPQRKRAQIDDACVRDKVSDLDARIHAAIKSKDLGRISTLWDKIKVMRQSGLEQHGEFGCENIAFKLLRNSGCIGALKDARTALQDLELSLREAGRPQKRFRYGFSENIMDPTQQPYSSADGVAPTTKSFLEDTDNSNNIVQDFIRQVTTELGIDPVPEIHLHTDPDWSENNNSFGRYDPDSHTLNVSLPNRHVMDVLRTVAHELVHCSQNQQHGQLPDDAGETGSRWENDANARAGIIMRDWANSHPEHFAHNSLEESASGYIPKNKREAAMPQYAMALSVDIKPGQVGKEANKLGLKTGRNGEPGLLMPEAQNLLREFAEFTEEQDNLFEISMSPSSLKKLSAQTGALAGMEFEMIVPGAGDNDDGDQEPDYDFDQRCRSIGDAMQFFFDGDWNGRRDVERMRERMQNDYAEWLYERLDTDFNNESEYLISEWVANNVDESEWNPDDLEGEARQEALDEFIANVDADPSSDYYQQALDEYREEYRDSYDESDWLDAEDLDLMSGVENAYSINWPHWRSTGGGEVSIEDTANSFRDAVGRPILASTSYHSGRVERPSTRNLQYIVEPDASLDPDDNNDQGLEFVSPPLPIEELLSDLNKVKAWADRTGCYTNDSTGLHINVSVPGWTGSSTNQLDYVKLALLLGDEFVLDSFGRAGNTYAKSAMGKIRDAVRKNPDRAQELMDKMKSGMDQLASKVVHSRSTEKYTSINVKDGYIEFRSPGGDWLNDKFPEIENTLRRFTVALSAAVDPAAYREEYLKKLYKLLDVSGEKDPLSYFAKFAAGELPKAALKSFVRQAQLERGIKRGKEQPGPTQQQPQTGEQDYVVNFELDDGQTGSEMVLQAANANAAMAYVRDNLEDEGHEVVSIEAQAVPAPSPAASTTTSHPEGRGRPHDPTGRYAIVARSDQAAYGRTGGPAPTYQFRFNMQNLEDQGHGRYVLQAWAARNSVDPADYIVVDTTQYADAAQGGIIDVAPASPAAGGEFTGNWLIRAEDGTVLHRFGGIGNSQADANRTAQTWAQRNPDVMRQHPGGVDVVPEMNESLREYRMPQPSQGPGRYRDLNEPLGPETPPTMPAGTVKVDVSDVYDWYKLGQHISNMKDLGQHDFGQGPPSAILSFGDEDLEHQYIQALKKTGLTTTDIDPVDPDQPPGMLRQKTDPTYNVDESLTETDQLTLRDFNVKLSPHHRDQAHAKGVDLRRVDDILFNLSKVKDKIMSLEPGRAFILHDGQGTGMGMRRHRGNRLTLATVYPTKAGFIKGQHPTFVVDTDSRINESIDADKVLHYVKQTHGADKFDIEYSITDHPQWELKNISLSELNLDPDGEQQDPYNRTNWVDYDVVRDLMPKIEQVLKANPIVVDSEGWIIDGNHRAMAAAEAGLTSVPALVPAVGKEGVAGSRLNEFAPGGNSASSYYAVTENFVNEFAQQKQEEIQDLIDAGWTKQDLAQAGTQKGAAADIVHLEQVRDSFLKGLKPGFDAYLQGDTQLKDQLGAYWIENDLPLNQDWEKVYGEPWGDDSEFNEDMAEGLTEARNSLFAFVKQQFPTWPDYVLKDFLYPQAKGIRNQVELDDFLKRNKQDFGNCKWTLTELPITFGIFTPKTQRMLASREGGNSNPFQVPRDAERHAQQLKMIQQTGVSAEPIIVAKLPNGYDLIEGWHRTIQHLKAFPQGYTGPAWVCTGATYKSVSVEQDMAENFADGKNPGRKEIDPDVYEDLSNSIIARTARQIVPTIRAKSTPEGYVYLSTQDGLSLVIGCNIAGGSIDINIGSQPMETTSSGPHKGAVTKIIEAVYQAAAKKYGAPIKQGTLSIDHDAGHGVWQHIAQKLGLQHDAHMVKENFADGKNPGRKGLAKRSGVNTKASVSSLRKTAKNSSGEKQRMSHWLANMKAGRAKAKRK